MLREVKKLHNLTLHALDGEIGSVDEILFDDENWTVRYLVVKTGSWLFGRKVLISPMSFGHWDWEHHNLHLKLSREQIEKSPGVETDQPVSRQWETGYYDYYAMPYYWVGMSGWGAYSYPNELAAQPVGSRHTPLSAEVQSWDHSSPHAHLRSTKEVTGYGITATDGHLGHVEDFILNDDTWRISYLAVDTRDWLAGKIVLLPPSVITQMEWPEMRVTVSLSREQVKNAPEWTRGQPITYAFEDELYGYYARQRIAPVALPSESLSTETLATVPTLPTIKDTVVAVYDTHGEAEVAVRELQHLGFDMTKLSIVGRDYQVREEVVGFYNAGDRMKAWGATGAFWGGIWSVLFGSAFFIVPGIGPILAAGPLVVWIAGVLETAAVVGGVSALGAALASIGIPNDSIVEYETQIKAGKFLVIAHDTQGKLEKARIALTAGKLIGDEPLLLSA